jgi:predicted DNA-binding WGR domain protein
VGAVNQPAADEGAWRFARFERETRYYELRLQRDLFGWIVLKAWGRKSTRLGQARTTPCSDFQEAVRVWDAGIRQRQRRGYAPLWQSS